MPSSTALASALRHPTELLALARYSRKASAASAALRAAPSSASFAYVYDVLPRVSRSFALVILELPARLRGPIAVFYVVLRALDTVEDDTRVDARVRKRICRRFWETLDGRADEVLGPSEERDFGTGDERELVEGFEQVVDCFAELEEGYRRVIRDITRRMGAGMADHIDDVECVTMEEYDLYCHYVAGLVGHGLTDMFVAGGWEDASFFATAQAGRLANSMGLFLQKTNIVRDFHEDALDARTFWPRDVWGVYGDDLTDFIDCAGKGAMPVLNALVTDALRRVPDCIEYMANVRNKEVFNFVAIPQVMAIATLAEVFNNPAVFSGKVKIRRSLTASLVLRTTSVDAAYAIFFDFSVAMLSKVDPSDPGADATRAVLNHIIDICAPHVAPAPDLIIPNVISIIAFCGLSSYVLKRRAEHFDGAVFTWRSAGGIMEAKDMLAVALLFLVCVYLFSFFLLPYFSRAQMEELRRIESEERAKSAAQAEAADARLGKDGKRRAPRHVVPHHIEG